MISLRQCDHTGAWTRLLAWWMITTITSFLMLYRRIVRPYVVVLLIDRADRCLLPCSDCTVVVLWMKSSASETFSRKTEPSLSDDVVLRTVLSLDGSYGVSSRDQLVCPCCRSSSSSSCSYSVCLQSTRSELRIKLQPDRKVLMSEPSSCYSATEQATGTCEPCVVVRRLHCQF